MRRMIPIGIVLLVAAAGCRDEPTFDKRYDAAQEKISASAERIDQDLAADPQIPGAAPWGDGTGSPGNRLKAEPLSDRPQ